MAQNLEIISKIFQFSKRRTKILVGFIIYYLALIMNPMGRILVRWKYFRNNFEILCHPIYNRLYQDTYEHDLFHVSTAGLPFDSVGILRTTLLLRTTRMCSWSN